MQKNLTEQLSQVVHSCYDPNAEKTTKRQTRSENSFLNLRALANELCAFIGEHYPEIFCADSIDSSIIQAFINTKPADCNHDTLYKIMSRIRTLERWCKHVYPEDEFDWGTKRVIIPKSTKTGGITKNTPVPLSVSREIIPELFKVNSEAVHATILSTYLGMRVRETTFLKVKSIYFTDGEFDLGFVHIPAGYEGGTKNGEARIIPILDKETQDALKSIIAGKNPDDYVVAKRNGKRMTVKNVLRILAKVMDLKYGETYKGNRCHGMRKTWAQRCFDAFRKKYSREIAIIETSQALGHKPPYGEDNLESYVPDIY